MFGRVMITTTEGSFAGRNGNGYEDLETGLKTVDDGSRSWEGCWEVSFNLGTK